MGGKAPIQGEALELDANLVVVSEDTDGYHLP